MVLKGLLNGLEVKHKKQTYKMYTTDGEYVNGGYDLCIVANSYDTITKETSTVGMRTHMSLGEFVAFVEGLSEEEFAIFAGNMVLNGL